MARMLKLPSFIFYLQHCYQWGKHSGTNTPTTIQSWNHTDIPVINFWLNFLNKQMRDKMLHLSGVLPCVFCPSGGALCALSAFHLWPPCCCLRSAGCTDWLRTWRRVSLLNHRQVTLDPVKQMNGTVTWAAFSVILSQECIAPFFLQVLATFLEEY